MFRVYGYPQLLVKAIEQKDLDLNSRVLGHSSTQASRPAEFRPLPSRSHPSHPAASTGQGEKG